MGRDIPEGAGCFGLCLFGGEADIAQHVIIQPCKGVALPKQGVQRQEAGPEAGMWSRATGQHGGAEGEDAGHGGGFHVSR